MYRDYLSQMEMKICSEFWISHNDGSRFILCNYENEIIRNSLYSSHFLKRNSLVFKSSDLLDKYENHIQDKDVALEERKIHVMENQ